MEALLKQDISLQIVIADSGEKAIQQLRVLPPENIPEIFILDYNLPKFNGYPILTFLKNNPLFTGVLRLVWSTSNSPLYKQRCLEEAASAYIVTPLNVGGIKKVAAAILTFCTP